MPAAEARVDTGRASRYLAQLCHHVQEIYTSRGPLSHARRISLAGHAPGHPMKLPRAEWTDTQGTVSFPGGTITLHATPDALILRADADTQHNLQHAQRLVTERLARFGRRDHLTVTWYPLDPPARSQP